MTSEQTTLLAASIQALGANLFGGLRLIATAIIIVGVVHTIWG